MTVCDSVGLNPLTKPFEYISLSGRLVLYARKDATDQLRDKRKVNIIKLERERMDSIYTVTAYAQTADGRQDSSIGAVNIENLKGDALANAIMKAETKAKRRVTLSICGLGMLDETELETIPNVTIIEGDNGNGNGKQPEPERPAVTIPEMSYETACTFKSSHGDYYKDLDAADLRGRMIGLKKILNDPKQSAARKEEALQKYAAITAILEHPAPTNEQQPSQPELGG
jgi:hypothetical protein